MQTLSLTTYWGGTPTPVSPFNFKRSITIDSTKVPNTDQTDFPVLIEGTYTYLKTVANGGDVENASGYDICFFSDINLTVPLAWEIDHYSATTGAVGFWVNVPLVETASDTVIYMAYGDAGIITFQGDINGTWNSAYKAVYHLPNGTALTANDSTVNGNNGTLGTFGPDPVTGYINGGALAVNGFSPNINIGQDTSLEISGAITMSCWANFDSVGILQNIICKGSEDYRLRLNSLSIDIGSFNGADHQTSYASAISTGTWYYISGGYDGSNWKLFLDGALVSTTADATGALITTSDARLMSSTLGIDRFMEGSLDEVRISDVFRSADWTATEYNNQSDPATFYALSAPL